MLGAHKDTTLLNSPVSVLTRLHSHQPGGVAKSLHFPELQFPYLLSWVSINMYLVWCYVAQMRSQMQALGILPAHKFKIMLFLMACIYRALDNL